MNWRTQTNYSNFSLRFKYRQSDSNATVKIEYRKKDTVNSEDSDVAKYKSEFVRFSDVANSDAPSFGVKNWSSILRFKRIQIFGNFTTLNARKWNVGIYNM